MLRSVASSTLCSSDRSWPAQTRPALRALLLLVSLALLTQTAHGKKGENPYLSASDDKPATAAFAGSEWGDDVGPKERPITARVVTTRLAELPFVSVYRIDFADVRSAAGTTRQIASRHFVVTATEIALLQEEDIEAAIDRLRALTKAPGLATPDLRAIAAGRRKLTGDASSSSSLTVQGGRCTYRYTHSAGHFTTMVWQRGVGLVEYAQGRGARADGFRVQRAKGSSH